MSDPKETWISDLILKEKLKKLKKRKKRTIKKEVK